MKTTVGKLKQFITEAMDIPQFKSIKGLSRFVHNKHAHGTVVTREAIAFTNPPPEAVRFTVGAGYLVGWNTDDPRQRNIDWELHINEPGGFTDGPPWEYKWVKVGTG